jgi:ABC-type multidrug transport system fused ATPase/permease subunit
MELIKKVLFMFKKSQRIQLVFLVFILFGGALFELIGVSLIMPFVQLVMEPDIISNNSIMSYFYNLFELKSDKQFLVLMAIALIVVYILKNIYLMLMSWLVSSFVYRNQLRISTSLMKCYMNKPYTFHLQNNSADIIRSVNTDVKNLFELIMYILLFISEIFVAIVMGLYLLVMDVEMTLVVVGLLLGCSLLYLKLIRKKLKSIGEINQHYQGQMIKSVNQALGGIKETKVLQREKYFVDIYKNNGENYVESMRVLYILNVIPKPIIETVCVAGIMLVIINKLMSGDDISSIVPQLSVFALASFRLLPSVARINNYINNILFYKPSIDLVYKDMKGVGDISELMKWEDEDTFNKIQVTKDDIIKVEHLSFAYPDSTDMILDDVSFELPISKSIAFIGTSGAGKTTFANILLGLLEPVQGDIKCKNVNIHTNRRVWSSLIGYIPQTIYLCDDTIRNNVAFGIPENEISDDDIWQALDQAQLKKFVESLENGLDTFVGESGVRLSGGQRQRIGIARALYHKPSILVLDEATSALDNETEAAVMESIEMLQGNITLIIIAHRLSTIKSCDKVYKVENQKITLTKDN